jgi:hypothetical protein
VIAQYQDGTIKTGAEAATLLWDGMIGFCIEAVIGFWFGARATMKRPQRES